MGLKKKICRGEKSIEDLAKLAKFDLKAVKL